MSPTTYDSLLIQEVQKNENLYDTEHCLYWNKVARQSAWDEVAKSVGRSNYECQQRWRDLRDKFVKEVKRLIVDENGTLDVSLSKWKYTPKLMFLQKHILGKAVPIKTTPRAVEPTRKRRGRLSHNIESTNEIESEVIAYPVSTSTEVETLPNESWNDVSVQEVNNPIQVPVQRPVQVQPETPPSKKMAYSVPPQLKTLVQPAPGTPNTIHNITTGPDADDLFFSSLAAMVKKIPDRKRSKLRLKIAALVDEAMFSD